MYAIEPVDDESGAVVCAGALGQAAQAAAAVVDDVDLGVCAADEAREGEGGCRWAPSRSRSSTVFRVRRRRPVPSGSSTTISEVARGAAGRERDQPSLRRPGGIGLRDRRPGEAVQARAVRGDAEEVVAVAREPADEDEARAGRGERRRDVHRLSRRSAAPSRSRRPRMTQTWDEDGPRLV